MFISKNVLSNGDKDVHLQFELCLEKINRGYPVRLVMNLFVHKVRSFMEVSSRNYLFASDECVHPLLGSWLRTHQERAQYKGEICLERTLFQLGMELKRFRNN